METEAKTESQQASTEVDERGVPLQNRVKELERKLTDKYERELTETRKELENLKSSLTAQKMEAPPEDLAKGDLMEFVKNPREFIANSYRSVEFQKEIPQAESWLKGQKGYTAEDDARIFQIIKENKLDTPYHTPMERAKVSWRLLNAEKHERDMSSVTEDQRREASVRQATTEGTGKATSKEKTVTRVDLIRKLQEAEMKGDLEASVRITGLLEDIR